MTLSKNISKFRTNIPLWISLILLIISLTQTAYTIDYGDKGDIKIPSLYEFLVGWAAGIVCTPYLIPWLANPFLIISWIKFKRKPNTALLLSFLSVVFAASFLLFDTVPVDEAPNYKTISQHDAGYWLWLISCISFFLGTYIIVVYRNFKLKRAVIK